MSNSAHKNKVGFYFKRVSMINLDKKCQKRVTYLSKYIPTYICAYVSSSFAIHVKFDELGKSTA